MDIKVMSWNMAGAKMLKYLDSPPDPVAKSYINAYSNVWSGSIQRYFTNPRKEYPDIILLQECIGFEDLSANPSGRWVSGEFILQQIFQGYKCFFFPAVSSLNNPHPAKWNKYGQGGAVKNYIPDYVNIQQGYGICIKADIQPRTLWVPHKKKGHIHPDVDKPDQQYRLCFEPINITTGLYLGNRDTEPRQAILGRILLSSGGEERYVNFLNLHLNTLKGEREGSIRLNRLSSRSRTLQLELVLDNVISAYQETSSYRMPHSTDKRKEDIWIMGGDFNSTPDSEEIALIERMGFVDGNTQKEIEDEDTSSPYHNQIGTKWSLSNRSLPPIVLDYIFCGLERMAFPANKLDTKNSKRPFRPSFTEERFESDHAVLFVKFKL